jgi:hypothetical protein
MTTSSPLLRTILRKYSMDIINKFAPTRMLSSPFGRLPLCLSVFNAVMLSLLAVMFVASCGGGVSGGGTGGSVPTSSSRGPINGLGSIIVAGVEFDDPINQTQAEDGAKLSNNDLTLGVQVSVLGASQTLQASGVNPVQSIVIQRRFMGVLQSNEREGKPVLSINGQRILTDRRSIVVGRLAAQEFAGQKVLVSGYLEPARNDIIATRIELAPASVPIDRVYITAKVQAVDTDAKLALLGFTTVSFAQALDAGSAIKAGDIIRFEASAVAGSTKGVVASRWSNVGVNAFQGDITLRGVVASRPTSSSPNSPLVVDGHSVFLSQAALVALPDLRKGSTVEVKGRLEQTGIFNANVRIIGYPIDPLLGEETVQEPVPVPGAPPVDDYVIKGGIVESVDTANNSYVVRGVRIQTPAGASLPPEIYVGSRVSLAGQVRQSPTGFYLESVITTPDRQWRAAQQIATTDGAKEVMIDGSGQARIVWREPGTNSLQTTLYVPDNTASNLGTWTAYPSISLGSVPLTHIVFGKVNQPASGGLGINANALGMVAYVAGKCVYAKPIGVQDSQWRNTQQVSVGCDENISLPVLALEAGGNAMLAWVHSIPSSGNVIKASVFSAQTQTWSAPATLSAPTLRGIYPAVAINGSGQSVVTWSELFISIPDPYFVSYASFYSLGLWATPTQIFSTREIERVGIDNSGVATMLASDQFGMQVAQYDANTGVRTSLTTLDSAPVNRSLLGLDGAGNVVVIWQDNITDGKLYASQFNKALGTWSSVKNIVNASQTADLQSIATDANGNALLSYAELGTQGVALNAYAVRYSFSNNSWGAPAMLEGTPPNFPASPAIRNEPRVAMNDRGEALITWQQLASDGSKRSFASFLR